MWNHKLRNTTADCIWDMTHFPASLYLYDRGSFYLHVFIESMDKQLHPSVRCNYLPITNLSVLLSLGVWVYWAYDYLSMLGLDFIDVNKRGPSCISGLLYFVISPCHKLCKYKQRNRVVWNILYSTKTLRTMHHEHSWMGNRQWNFQDWRNILNCTSPWNFSVVIHYIVGILSKVIT